MVEFFCEFIQPGVLLLEQVALSREPVDERRVCQLKFAQAFLERLCTVNDSPDPTLNSRRVGIGNRFAISVVDCKYMTVDGLEFLTRLAPKNPRDCVDLSLPKRHRLDPNTNEWDFVLSLPWDFSWQQELLCKAH